MNTQDAYTDWSSTYDSDRNLTRDLDAAVTHDVLAGLRCVSILETGCGTGKNTAFLAQLGRHVHALDFSEGMIARAADKLRLSNVSFTAADLTRRWPVNDRSVDLISCNLVLEHIQELGFIFFEGARVLAAGGRFFICELHPFRQYQGTKAHYQRWHGTTEIPAFVHHLSDFTATATSHGFALLSLKEWWHAEDQDEVPRLVSFLFEKPAA
ncbi:MAG: class I SAM-dependent methyltransferase [Opitutaceae bacterium]|nr:class I SAM-dependent methyltransferase [Opitutaceae bacterium]